MRGEKNVQSAASAGLPGTPAIAHRVLKEAGIDPDRLSIHILGHHGRLAGYRLPPWAWRMILGYVLWVALHLIEGSGLHLPPWGIAIFALITGLIILQASCQVLVTVTERFAARMRWSHYVAGTVAEILATLPECVVIGFVILVSPLTALTLALITIYSNALVFSIYSYFLPRDHYGKFLMPKPITDAGTQLLIAGGAIGLVLGFVMLVFKTGQHEKQAFAPIDFFVLGGLLLIIFAVYMHKLILDLGHEEEQVHEVLELTADEKAHRRSLAFANVSESSLARIGLLFLVGLVGALFGGEKVGEFAEIAIRDLGLSDNLAALTMAVFAGMSEYVILYTSHRKKNYGLALANAIGGITQLLFLIVPFTLAGIAFYQALVNPGHPEFPITFSIPLILLVAFLFPTLHTLAALLENDHTMGVLDTVIMIGIVALLILLLISYG